MSIQAASLTALIGHNGSGKSTLLKILARQHPASGGTVRFAGKPLNEWGDREFARKLAYLPQQTAAASGMLVKELVALGRYPWHGALGRFGAVDRQKVEEAIELTGIAPFTDRMVDTLSGANGSAYGLPCWLHKMPNACCSTSRHQLWISRIRLKCFHLCRNYRTRKTKCVCCPSRRQHGFPLL